MTDEELGKLIREYGDACNEIQEACKVIRQTEQVTDNLRMAASHVWQNQKYPLREMMGRISQVSLARLAMLPDAGGNLVAAYERKTKIRSKLDEAGYGAIVKDL